MQPEEPGLTKSPSELDRALTRTVILVDERPTPLRPTSEEMRAVVLPLLQWCRANPHTGARGLVGIAAPPGAGKSVLAAWLAAVANALHWHEFAFISLDGYHLPNAVLDARRGPDPDGNLVAMRKLKGTPPTFDADRLLADLKTLKASRRERRLPAYNRTLHDPEPEKVRIGPEVAWVFIEGNFLFLDRAPWCHVRSLLDRKVYLDAPDEILKQDLARRHSSAGRDTHWFQKHFRITDGPNIRLIRAAAPCADITYQRDHSGRIRPSNPES